ncbi:MAG: orotidine-5'-phosphate decarboxylase [Rhodospirillales bacterium]|jgi:orotidine-5'-phosphate decarboxylase|nr:orotidine-5'-phosphate decarboxylase [Rhodospirillales bacterium]MDP6804305.1 orotidine-5'-phosphate decarboxylase [Rhodospirillales bacterium]
MIDTPTEASAQPNAGPERDARERLIVALNSPTVDDAQELIGELEGLASVFKIGLQLQIDPRVGELIETLIENRKRVFLDYKYYDIADTVGDATARAAKMGISFLTVHGETEIVSAAVGAKKGSELKVLCVTVLTSLDSRGLSELFGRDVSVENLVRHRISMAMAAGCDGAIAAPADVAGIRGLAGRDFLIVTPGVRLEGESADDHKRAGTPASAIAAGADYLVVGRPIINAPDVRAAATRYIEEMQSAFDRRP